MSLKRHIAAARPPRSPRSAHPSGSSSLIPKFRLMSADKINALAPTAWGAGVEQLLDDLDAQTEALAALTEAWSAINSGSFELAGLALIQLCRSWTLLSGV